MKQNPCRYCALSTKTRYGHKPSHDNECVDCINLKKHEEYLDEHFDDARMKQIYPKFVHTG